MYNPIMYPEREMEIFGEQSSILFYDKCFVNTLALLFPLEKNGNKHLNQK